MSTVTSTQLKTHLGKYLREVRSGGQVCVTDRGEPVAKLVPFDETAPGEVLRVAKPRAAGAPRLGKLKIKPIRYLGTKTGALLRETRGRR